MQRLSLRCASTLLLTLPGAPAFAHFTSATQPHLHASDVAGLAAVVALTIGAGWLDRRLARRRRERAAVDPRRDPPASSAASAADPRDGR
jgi:hypothetical protein